MSERPADVRIEDLADPVLAPDVRERFDQMAALLPSLTFTVEALCLQATQETGLSNFGDPGFRERLALLLDVLRSDHPLSPAGEVTTHFALSSFLRNRLRLEDLLARHPEIAEIELVPPIIIAGLPRSGTTHLHNLISADPNMRSLPYWEALEPVPADGEQPDPSLPDPRMASCAVALEMHNGALPYFKRMHEMTVEHVHEEIHLLGIDFSTMFFENMGLGAVPSWRDYYLAHDQTPHYAYLKKILQALQWLRGGKRWILKSPQHLEQLEPIRNVFPEATVVVTHRDPVSIVASFATMISYSSRLSAKRVDVQMMGGYWADRVEDLLRAVTRDREKIPAEQSIDVRFDEFMADDVAAVRKIYEIANQPLPASTLAALDRYMAEHPRGRHGRVLYDLADFGLDGGELRERMRFYTDRFGVALES